MIIIPIGIDCDVADSLRKLNIRKYALPFDWNVTYTGVKDIFENNFKDFVPQKRFSIYANTDNSCVFNKYNVLFMHEDWKNNTELHQEKYKKRIERLNELLLNTSETIYFIRKGHMYLHHKEYYYKDDIESVKELNIYLKEFYPQMKFKIILILSCLCCNMQYKNEIIDENITIRINNSNNFCQYFLTDIVPLIKD